MRFAKPPKSRPESRAASFDSEAPTGFVPFEGLSELIERDRDFNGPCRFRFTVTDKPLWIPRDRFSNGVGCLTE